MKDKYLIVIVGPTAVGKTDLSIWLAKQLNTEIISADSRQIYKEMSIGTAKPTAEEMQGIKHHFIGEISVRQYFNASMYEQLALQRIEQLFEKYDLLLLVGGSGLYIDAILFGIDDIPTVIPQVRQQIAQIYNEYGIDKLRYLVSRLDPEYYKKADLNNPMRLLKALEISVQAAKPYSSFLKGTPKQRNFKTILIGLNMPREMLYQRINKRVIKMIDQGLVQEAKKLYSLKDLVALKTVGYREIFQYLDGKISLPQAIDLIQRNTRKYARRQLTWFRRYKNIRWFRPDEKQEILNFILQKIS